MTILYKSDLDREHAYIDYETKNKSFTRLSLVLKKMGIKNNYFFLSLLDRDLIGVDPRSPDLTVVQKAKILRECKRNVWYFIREVVVKLMVLKL